MTIGNFGIVWQFLSYSCFQKLRQNVDAVLETTNKF